MIRFTLLLLLTSLVFVSSEPTVRGFIQNVYWSFKSEELVTFSIYRNQKIHGLMVKINSTTNSTVKALNILRNENVKFLPDKVSEIFPNLIAYQAAKCSVTAINKYNFEKLYKLEWLYLGHNQIEKISNNIFDDLIALKFLSLNNNKIKSISANAFKNLKNLINLSINYNELNYLEIYTLHGLQNLKNISLQHNNIDMIESKNGHHHFPNNIMLEYIWLNNNKLRIVGMNIFDQMSELKYVDLRENECVDQEFFKNQTLELKNYLEENCSSVTLLKNLIKVR